MRRCERSAATQAGTIIRAKAPLRISFAGGGTDLPHWYEEHGGAVFSSTINRFAYVTLYPRDDRDVRIRSLDLGYMVQYDVDENRFTTACSTWRKQPFIAWGPSQGMELDVVDAPAGSGLGGSSALTAAVIGALARYTGHALDATNWPS